MNEIEELRKRIEEQNYVAALQIVDELEEMSKEDKLNKIYSYMVILLIQLIKQIVENRSTSSWDRSIYNSVDNLNRTNKRRKSGGYYANAEMLKEIFEEAYPRAIKEASFEVFEGKLSEQELEQKVDCNVVRIKALSMLQK